MIQDRPNGREAIKKYYTDLFQNVHFSNNVTTYDPNSPHILGTDSNEMWENGEWRMTWLVKGGDPVQGKGYHASIHRLLFVRAVFGRSGCSSRT